MWGYGPYGGGWGMGLFMLFGGVFWIMILVLGAFAVAWLVRSGHPARIERGAAGLDILEERYARGEIGRDEYLQKKRDILGRGAAGWRRLARRSLSRKSRRLTGDEVKYGSRRSESGGMDR